MTDDAGIDMTFLFDVDNTLLDNDRVIADLRHHLVREVGFGRADQFFEIFEQLRSELGYSDTLGALQRYRQAHPRDPHLLTVSSFLVNYPFAQRLYPGALDAVAHAGRFGPTVILSDGDVVFQPLKIERAGIARAVAGRVLIYIHKEQGARARRRRTTLPGRPLRAGGRQDPHPHRGQAGVGRSPDDRLSPPGALRARRGRDDVPEARRHDRTHRRARRSRRSRPTRRRVARRRLAALARSASLRLLCPTD
jgi:hypothetical protein